MLAWKRKGNARPGGGKNQTIQMRIELIKHPMRESCGVEHRMTAVHHMIVEGQNHERGIGDDSTEPGVFSVRSTSGEIGSGVRAPIRLDDESVGGIFRLLSHRPHDYFDRTDGGKIAMAENLLPWWSLARRGTVRNIVVDGLAFMWAEGSAGSHARHIAGPFTELGCGIFVHGDEVTVEGSLGRNKSNLANARSVVMTATGKKLGAASSEGAQ